MEESTPSLPARATLHTPGPWLVHPVDYLLVVDNDGNEIAHVVCEPGTDEHDARLIAAAPDLAEALEGLLAWFDAPPVPLGLLTLEAEAEAQVARWERARAALAKAGRP